MNIAFIPLSKYDLQIVPQSKSNYTIVNVLNWRMCVRRALNVRNLQKFNLSINLVVLFFVVVAAALLCFFSPVLPMCSQANETTETCACKYITIKSYEMCTRTKIISTTTTTNNKQQPKRLSARERVAAAAAHLSDAIVCVCNIRNDRIEFIWIENVYLRWAFVVWSVWDDANVFVCVRACVCVKTGLSDVQNRMWWYEHTRALWQKLKQSFSVVVAIAVEPFHMV